MVMSMKKNAKKLPIRLIAEENPDLPAAFIKDILLAQMEAAEQKTSPYIFDKSDK